MSNEVQAGDHWRFNQDNDSSESPPPGYYGCYCKTMCVELFGIGLFIALPIILGDLRLYQIVGPIVFIILIIIWAWKRTDL